VFGRLFRQNADNNAFYPSSQCLDEFYTPESNFSVQIQERRIISALLL
jgi:hypothetical protein